MTEPYVNAMNAEETSALQRVGARLERVLTLSLRISEPPVQGSRLHQAHKADLSDAYHLASACMFSAEDHLRTILQILKTGPLPTYSLYTLLRAACEADVRSRYLLDPTITERQRLARALTERLDNLGQQRKILPTSQLTQFERRVDHLEKRAIANGITPIRNRSGSTRTGRIVAFGEREKTDHDLFSAYIPTGSLAFRFLSGHVHSKPWVQLQIGHAEPSDDPLIALVRTEIDVRLFASLLDTALDLRYELIGLWLMLAGRPPAGASGSVEKVARLPDRRNATASDS